MLAGVLAGRTFPAWYAFSVPLVAAVLTVLFKHVVV